MQQAGKMGVYELFVGKRAVGADLSRPPPIYRPPHLYTHAYNYFIHPLLKMVPCSYARQRCKYQLYRLLHTRL